MGTSLAALPLARLTTTGSFESLSSPTSTNEEFEARCQIVFRADKISTGAIVPMKKELQRYTPYRP